MGRPEKPVDQTVPELARLATFLRDERAKANRSYAVLADVAEVSAATLKRAAAGTSLPTWRTVRQYLRACYVKVPEPVYVRVAGETFFTDFYSPEFRQALHQAGDLWDLAEEGVQEAENCRPRPMPTCRYVYDEADLSARLRELHAWARSPSAHAMEERAGEFGVLPHSTAHRIIKGKALPRRIDQLHGFLRACGLPESKWEDWITAWWQVDNIRSVQAVENKMHLIIDDMVEREVRRRMGISGPRELVA
ncbi:helix-turn-helix domain-containing protein (plasmid) [Streptomyces erythrochromogenes]|uniref:Helix-turn-helix domain-containing protein n=1 Tax=Streptomyces erythrochromogenes TaxID=285574 RepID=A0ABZ1QQE4_9ACTN|nr:helix-turn-helix domain-containing protein [Streptomyces erythrochromogenes]